MNKHITAALSVVLLGATTGLYAYPFAGSCTSYNAGTICSNTTVPTVQSTNDTKMRGTTVQNAATIGGKLSATESSIGSLQVKSDAELIKSTVFGNATIGGDFRAEKSSISSLNVQGKTDLEMTSVQNASTFKGDFRANASNLTSATMNASKVSLSHSSINSLTMKAAKAVVCLNGSSVNKLTFTHGGSVYKDSSSNVTSLSGGKIVAGNCPF